MVVPETFHDSICWHPRGSGSRWSVRHVLEAEERGRGCGRVDYFRRRVCESQQHLPQHLKMYVLNALLGRRYTAKEATLILILLLRKKCKVAKNSILYDLILLHLSTRLWTRLPKSTSDYGSFHESRSCKIVHDIWFIVLDGMARRLIVMLYHQAPLPGMSESSQHLFKLLS